MRNFLTILLLVFFCTYGLAQEQRITLAFDNVALEDAVNAIEDQAGIRFFYVSDWFGRSLVSGSYENQLLDEVLEDIFKDTLINFYFASDGSVILTRNNLIIDQLPEEYFGRVEQESTGVFEEEINPLFVQEEQADDIQEIETVRIGRQTRNNRRRTFTLTGVALNAANGNPISEMAIVVQGSNLGTSTDVNGVYSLELPAGINILEARSLGIATKRIRVIIYNNGNLNFEMEESFTELDEVVVSGETDRNVSNWPTCDLSDWQF